MVCSMEFQLCFRILSHDGVRVHAVMKLFRDTVVEEQSSQEDEVDCPGGMLT